MLGNIRVFDLYKGLGALKVYFKLVKQFIVYIDRVVDGRDYYFGKGEDKDLHRPEDIIEPNSK